MRRLGTWRVFLKALEALPMDAAELAIYRHHTGRTAPPTKPARYAELVVGRRGGKSRILATIAMYLGCVLDHSDYIVPGETPVIADPQAWLIDVLRRTAIIRLRAYTSFSFGTGGRRKWTARLEVHATAAFRGCLRFFTSLPDYGYA